MAGGRRLTGEDLARFTAGETAKPLIPEFRSENRNSLVLRNPQGGGWLVYWLAASTDPNLLLLGGHSRFTVSEDGTVVLGRDKKSHLSGCFTLDKRHKPEGATGAVMLFSSDTVPWEIHVFLSLLYKTEMYVETSNGFLWKVENGKVSKTAP